jgi:DNA-binding LacI/PurR family transcriptional regulator
VAREAGVSATTVSHVINGTRFVAAETVERVHRAIEKLRYEVNYNARNLKNGRSRVIGLLVSDVTNPHFSGVVRGVEDVANRAGYHMILCNTDEDPQKELAYLRVLRGKGADGALLVPTGPRHDYLDHLVQAGFPLVFVDRALPGLPCDAVMADNVGGAREAVSHLIALGHRQIGIIARVERGGVPSQRLQGYQAALRDHGIAEDPGLVRDANARREEGFRETLALLALDAPPTAIFAAHNLTTLGALAALDARGRRVPDDVALIGFGDFEWAPLMRPRLTTVVQPEYEVGAQAAEWLIERIERRDDASPAPRRAVLPVRLAVRESCGASGYSHASDFERLFGPVAAGVAAG